MGHTLPTITGHFDRFQSNLTLFRRALRRTDQLALKSLLSEARQHLPAASYAANVLPDISFLLCLLLEKHKQAERHEIELERLRRDFHKEIENLRKDFRLEKAKLRTEYFLESGNSENAKGG